MATWGLLTTERSQWTSGDGMEWGAEGEGYGVESGTVDPSLRSFAAKGTKTWGES